MLIHNRSVSGARRGGWACTDPFAAATGDAARSGVLADRLHAPDAGAPRWSGAAPCRSNVSGGHFSAANSEAEPR